MSFIHIEHHDTGDMNDVIDKNTCGNVTISFQVGCPVFGKWAYPGDVVLNNRQSLHTKTKLFCGSCGVGVRVAVAPAVICVFPSDDHEDAKLKLKLALHW